MGRMHSTLGGGSAHSTPCSSVRGSAEGKKLARDARRALETLGIRRPPSTRSPEMIPPGPSRPGTGSAQHVAWGGQEGSAAAWVSPSPSCALRAVLPAESPGQRGGGGGDALSCTGIVGTPEGRGEHDRREHVSSPGDPGWDAELDDLLTWTEALGSLPEMSPGY